MQPFTLPTPPPGYVLYVLVPDGSSAPPPPAPPPAPAAASTPVVSATADGLVDALRSLEREMEQAVINHVQERASQPRPRAPLADSLIVNRDGVGFITQARNLTAFSGRSARAARARLIPIRVENGEIVFDQDEIARGTDHDGGGGMTDLEIDQLPFGRWTNQAGTCAVCQDDFLHGHLVIRLPRCGHVFHSGCIRPWLKNTATCPVCRADIDTTAADDDDDDDIPEPPSPE